MSEKRRFGALRLIAGNANRFLAEKIAAELGESLQEARVDRFADGEVRVDLECVVRGTDVFILQPICQTHHSPVRHACLVGSPPGGERQGACTFQSVNDSLVELLVLIDAVRRASAGRITAVVPYMAYAKQEKKKRGHEPITAKLVANLITTAGADRLLTVDLHTPAIEGFFDIPVDHMRMAFLMAAYFQPPGPAGRKRRRLARCRRRGPRNRVPRSAQVRPGRSHRPRRDGHRLQAAHGDRRADRDRHGRQRSQPAGHHLRRHDPIG
jgi:phosphoribosylpyrophosphate synthetase